jgi:hypothetical protein
MHICMSEIAFLLLLLLCPLTTIGSRLSLMSSISESEGVLPMSVSRRTSGNHFSHTWSNVFSLVIMLDTRFGCFTTPLPRNPLSLSMLSLMSTISLDSEPHLVLHHPLHPSLLLTLQSNTNMMIRIQILTLCLILGEMRIICHMCLIYQIQLQSMMPLLLLLLLSQFYSCYCSCSSTTCCACLC